MAATLVERGSPLSSSLAHYHKLCHNWEDTYQTWLGVDKKATIDKLIEMEQFRVFATEFLDSGVVDEPEYVYTLYSMT